MNVPEMETEHTVGARARVERIVRHAANRFGVETQMIYAKERSQAAVLARQYAWRMTKDDPLTAHYSLADLGEIFERDHTTIMAGIERERARMKAAGEGGA